MNNFKYKIQLNESMTQCTYNLEGGGIHIVCHPPHNGECDITVSCSNWDDNDYIQFRYSNMEVSHIKSNITTTPIQKVENVTKVMNTSFIDLLYEIKGLGRFESFINNYPSEYLRVYEDRINKEVGKLNKTIHKLNKQRGEMLKALSNVKRAYYGNR